MKRATKPGPRAAAPRGRKPRGLGHERRDEILEAAKQMFVCEGYETVTTRRLAEKVGLSQTGLYVYFSSKEEILDTLCRRTFDGLHQRMRTVIESMPPGLDRLDAIGRAYIEFALEHPEEYQLTFMVSPAVLRHPADKDVARAWDSKPLGLETFGLVLAEVGAQMEAGFIRRGDVLVATQTVWAAVHGLAALLIAKRDFPWADRGSLIETMIAMIHRGFAAPPAGTSPQPA